MPTFKVDAMVRGYHVYLSIWEASIYDELMCARELGNLRNPFAFTIIKSDQTVGHVPLKISSLCSLFLRCGRNITCKVLEENSIPKTATHVARGNDCVIIEDGGNWLRQVVKAWFLGQFLGFTSIPLLALCRS